MVNKQKLEIVVGCLKSQRTSLADTVPVALPATLYADKVTLVTPDHEMLAEIPGFYKALDAFGGIENETLQEYPAGEELMPQTDELMYIAYDKFDELIESGLSEKDAYNHPEFLKLEHEADRGQMQSIIEVVSNMLTRPEVLPLIYDPDSRLKKDVKLIGGLALSSKINKNATTRLGVELIQRLPSFENLDAEEIVELRSRLEPYLIPFRSYLVETSVALREAGYDENAIQDAIYEVYICKVLPVLTDLEKSIHDNGFLRKLLNDFGKNPRDFISSSISLGIFTAGEVSHLPLYASIGGAVASKVVAYAKEIHDEKGIIKSNNLYFLHEVERFSKKEK